MARQGGVVVSRAGSSPDLISLPATANRLSRFTQSGVGAKLSDSIFAQSADGHSIIVGVGASVNAGQPLNAPAVVLGEGCSAWGDGAIAIGKNVTVGSTAARAGTIGIGHTIVVNANHVIRIGIGLGFTVGVGDEAILIGNQVGHGGTGSAGIAIGRQATTNGDSVAIGRQAACANLFTAAVAIGPGANTGDSNAIAIGLNATVVNGGASGIAIGNGALAGHGFAIAIGLGANAQGPLDGRCIAIGSGASAHGSGGVGVLDGIAIGAGATVATSGQVRFGGAGYELVDFGVVSLNMVGAAMLLLQAYRPFADNDGNVGLRLMTKKAGVIVFDQVTFGAVDSGGVGFRLLRIPN